jgi:hypothetical protein
VELQGARRPLERMGLRVARHRRSSTAVRPLARPWAHSARTAVRPPVQLGPPAARRLALRCEAPVLEPLADPSVQAGVPTGPLARRPVVRSAEGAGDPPVRLAQRARLAVPPVRLAVRVLMGLRAARRRCSSTAVRPLARRWAHLARIAVRPRVQLEPLARRPVVRSAEGAGDPPVRLAQRARLAARPVRLAVQVPMGLRAARRRRSSTAIRPLARPWAASALTAAQALGQIECKLSRAHVMRFHALMDRI